MTATASRFLSFEIASPNITANQGICIAPGGAVSGSAGTILPGRLLWCDLDALNDTVPILLEVYSARHTSTGALIASIGGLATGALTTTEGVAGAAGAAPSELATMRKLWAGRANRVSGDASIRTMLDIAVPDGLVLFLRNGHASTAFSGAPIRANLGFSTLNRG